MFCPQCGATQSDDLKFCKACGANLFAVRKVMVMRETDEKFDWSKTWVAEMLMSSEEKVRRAAEIERVEGRSPEIKRRNEIKAGIITASVGVGLMITVYMVMQGIVLSGRVDQAVAEILTRVWVAGVIPILVGVSLIFNGLFVSKRGLHSREDDGAQREMDGPAEAVFLPPAETNPLANGVFSVTDQTTRNLEPAVRPKTSK